MKNLIREIWIDLERERFPLDLNGPIVYDGPRCPFATFIFNYFTQVNMVNVPRFYTDFKESLQYKFQNISNLYSILDEEN